MQGWERQSDKKETMKSYSYHKWKHNTLLAKQKGSGKWINPKLLINLLPLTNQYRKILQKLKSLTMADDILSFYFNPTSTLLE